MKNNPDDRDKTKNDWSLQRLVVKIFKDNLEKFYFSYDVSKADIDYCQDCENEKFHAFGMKMFRLKILNLIDEYRILKDKKTMRYYTVKNIIWSTYENVENKWMKL
ncbi:MAG: hypothetical protein Ta2E_00410 [Mycoplasmoidaceae bacterium]|nr:MAG: hypothetical protein Ta2E_00410 [Mycoplasmoidaceae bacterium]